MRKIIWIRFQIFNKTVEYTKYLQNGMGKQDITYIRFLCFYDKQRKQTRDMIVSKYVASIRGNRRYIIIICIYTIYVCIFKSAFVKVCDDSTKLLWN